MERSKYELNRKKYKDVKKMDHGQMSAFCDSIHEKGYEEGKKAAKGLSDSEIMQTLIQIKGIGEKKAKDIVNALSEAKRERGILTNG